MSIIAYKYRTNSRIESDGTRLDTKTLLSQQLFAASFDSLNDPFEASADLPYDDIPGNEWVIPLKQCAYSFGIYSLIKPIEGESFPCNELMWSHYADSHKGFCIEYDLDILRQSYSSSYNLIRAFDVHYQDERPIISKNDDIYGIIDKVCGTKSKAWEKENEFRLVFGDIGLKPVPQNAIKSIYFGLEMKSEERKQIIDGLKDRDIDFFQIERIGNSYQLTATKIVFTHDYEIIQEEHLPIVDNYVILYKSPNKDESTIKEFVSDLRLKYKRDTNITIIDDIRVVDLLKKPRTMWSHVEHDIISKHWIAYSLFHCPSDIWMYPEKKNVR